MFYRWPRSALQLLCLFGLLCLQPLVAANILVIESYHYQHPWGSSYRQALRQQLGTDNTLHFFYLDTKRIPKESFNEQATKAWHAYLALNPDLVILGDDNAINLLALRITANNTPVVYLGMNGNPRRNGFYGVKNLTGVLERPLMKRNVREMGQLIPSAKRALILFDDSDVSHTAIAAEFGNQNSLLLGDMTIDIKQINNYEHWKQEVAEAKNNGYGLIFIGLYHTITNHLGQYQGADQVLAWTGKNTQVPLFSFWDFSIGPRLSLGGLVISGKQQGEVAANLVRKILVGTNGDTFPPRIAPRGEYIFSRAALAHWNIELPEDIARRTEWRD